MDVKTAAGDVFFLGPNTILLYGAGGIALSLTELNMETLARVQKTGECVKDVDGKARRYTVGYDAPLKQFRFEIVRGEIIRCYSWQLVNEEQIAA
jgi:hypothetical protein